MVEIAITPSSSSHSTEFIGWDVMVTFCISDIVVQCLFTLENIQQLTAMFPDVQRHVLEETLETSKYDMNAAVSTLLNAGQGMRWSNHCNVAGYAYLYYSILCLRPHKKIP